MFLCVLVLYVVIPFLVLEDTPALVVWKSDFLCAMTKVWSETMLDLWKLESLANRWPAALRLAASVTMCANK